MALAVYEGSLALESRAKGWALESESEPIVVVCIAGVLHQHTVPDCCAVPVPAGGKLHVLTQLS